MKLPRRLERALDRVAIRNLTFYIVAGQGLAVLLGVAMPGSLGGMYLMPEAVMDGQWWRLFSFAFCPPSGNPVLAVFALYMLFLMGGALEHRWGALRYNLYVLMGLCMTIAASFAFPFGIATNAYVTGSIFLAFAYIFPDFEILLFFVMPVKVKWLALLTWIGYGVSLVIGDWSTRACVLASVANFLLFFGGDLYTRVRLGHRVMKREATAAVVRDKLIHTCSACGLTEKIDRTMDFRFCTKCDPPREYCANHLRDHEHLRVAG